MPKVKPSNRGARRSKAVDAISYLQESQNYQQTRSEMQGIILEAEAGVGKSTMLRYFAHAAHRRHIKVIKAKGRELSMGTGYFVVQRLLSQALFPNWSPKDGRAVAQSIAESRLFQWDKGVHDQLPFLRRIFPNFEYVLPSNIDEESSSRMTVNLFCSIIDLFSDDEGGVAITIDNLQWTDGNSWDCILALIEKSIRGVCLCVAARNLIDPYLAKAYSIIVESKGFLHIQLVSCLQCQPFLATALPCVMYDIRFFFFLHPISSLIVHFSIG